MANPLAVFREKDVVLILAGSINSLKVTLAAALSGTPVEFNAGAVVTTVGFVTSRVVIVEAVVSIEGGEIMPSFDIAATEYT